MDSLMVPSSIQRVRSFLVEMCGMKVKPWASTEETLGALATTLISRHRCDIFWTSLRVLLATLARDVKRREEARPGALLDNEVLDNERYAALLDEIRTCLARQEGETTTTTSFRRLAAGLSAPALALLLLLGGAATVGCDRGALRSAPKAEDAAVVDDASAARLDARPDTSTDIVPPAVPDTAPGPDTTSVSITLPDTGPVPDAATHGPDGATVTIQDIMDSCNLPSQNQTAVLACLARLRDSWTTGIAEALAGMPCDTVTSELSCFAYAGQACSFGSTAEFVVGTTRVCEPILVYVGVRFV